MGKKNRKKTTWRKLSLQDETTSKTSDGSDRSSNKSVDDSCNCQNNRNSRLHSMTVKKSFLSSRKYRQYPSYHATDYNSGIIGNGNNGDDSSNNSYTANEELAYTDDQQPMYFQPYVYPCFVTPTLVVPPYHPSQWYEDPRLPYDHQNFICLTQPLTHTSSTPSTSVSSSQPNSSSINSCSSPETGSEVGYSSSSPPAATRVSETGELIRDEEPPPFNYGNGMSEDGYVYSNQPFFHQVAGVLPEDQQPPSPQPFYSGTTFVLKPLAVMRRPPHEGWWDGEYNEYGGLGRRRRRRAFIGGEGITYDRWPSRINKEPYKSEVYQKQSHSSEAMMQADMVDENPTESLQVQENLESNRQEESHNADVSQCPDEPTILYSEQNEAINFCSNNLSSDETEKVANETIKEESLAELSTSLSNVDITSSQLSTTPTAEAWSSTCQDPLKYSKYYQICELDDEIEEEPERSVAVDTDVEKVDKDVNLKELENDNNPSKVDVEEIKVNVLKDEEIERVENVVESKSLQPITSAEEFEETGEDSNNPSECGSEDVEMLGHRYLSGADKLYKPNTISLAAELLGNNHQLPYDQQIKPLMERSKRVAMSTTTGYLSNSRHVLESYCSHLATAHQAGKLGIVCNNDMDEVDDIDTVDAVEEEVIFKRSSTEANVFQPQSVNGRHSGISPFLFLRKKGPWHGCCCSIM